jgi:outer membrane protein
MESSTKDERQIIRRAVAKIRPQAPLREDDGRFGIKYIQQHIVFEALGCNHPSVINIRLLHVSAARGGRMRARKAFNQLTFALTLVCSGVAYAQSATAQAAAHVEAGRYAAAYELLAPQEPDRAGDPEYDLLLGVAALETGRHTRAVFALERVLAVQPDNARARAEIGRAYLALGESAGARRELEAVRAQNVPPEVARSIDRLLSAIDRAPEAGKPSFSGFVEAAVGRDTNVNSATSANAVAVPGFGDFRLTASSKSRDAWFTGVSGGINARVPVNRDWSFIAGASGAGRFNGGESRFDTTALDGNVGAAWSRGPDSVTAAVQLGLFEVDDDKLRDYSGLSLQWQHTHDARNQTTAFMQHARLRYSGANDVRDVNRTIYGAGHAIVLPGGQALLFGSVYFGAEAAQRDVQPGVNVAGNDVIGFRIGAQYTLDPRWMLFGALASESRDYEDADPVFKQVREDTLTSLSFGASYLLRDNWRLTPSVSLTRNDSSLNINDYRRGVAQFAVRRTF